MSAAAQPITDEQFAVAIQDLPFENLYSKAAEIENSISHLVRSNEHLQKYIDSINSDESLPDATRQEGDKECSEAIQENVVVIDRQRDRIRLLKQEVERRGGRWHELNKEPNTNGSSGTTSTNGGQLTANSSAGAPRRLTDDELSQRMLERLAEDERDEDDGVHL
ncbi:hypothetical protein PV08_02937 [Exophiala spinifera]|uniref:Uncharacterized protein n=1 Tax=Exophiala spinifera TaxID=91928 RepID=A0A0D2BI60_9EURO|nr:uncharacterized protein PV08_02937 [Exophiala spinifera]KIW18648.1 hypothetical protein PV08_02937 [Exophiala spinifera]